MSTQVWQSQPLEAPRISLEFVRHQVEKLQLEHRRRNLQEYLAMLGAIGAYVFLIFMPSHMGPVWSLVMRLGCLLMIAAMIYATAQWHRRGRVLSEQAVDKVASGLDMYRAELQRRHDFFIGRWRWYLLPYAPGQVVLLVGGMMFAPEPELIAILLLVCAVLGTFFCLWLDKRGVRKYQRELDALATLDKKQANIKATPN